MIRKIISSLLLCCAALFLLSACKETTSYPVATLDASDNASLTDITKVKAYFAKVLNHSKVNEIPDQYSIVKTKGNNTNEAYYLLQASTSDRKVTIAIEVFKEEASLGITSASLTNGVVICKTNCTEGCQPLKLDGKLICSKACDGGSCEKIATVAYEENNYTTPIQAFLEKY